MVLGDRLQRRWIAEQGLDLVPLERARIEGFLDNGRSGTRHVSQSAAQVRQAVEDGAGSVGDGELVVASRDSAPLLDEREGPLDDVAVFVGTCVERGWSAALASLAFRAAIWSLFSGITARIPRARSKRRFTPLP